MACPAPHDFQLKVFLSWRWSLWAYWHSTDLFPLQISSVSLNPCKSQVPFSALHRSYYHHVSTEMSVLWQGNKELELRGGQGPFRWQESDDVQRTQWDCICFIARICISHPLQLTLLTLTFSFLPLIHVAFLTWLAFVNSTMELAALEFEPAISIGSNVMPISELLTAVCSGGRLG